MNGRTQAYLLLLLGAALLRLGASELLLRYVRPAARPETVLAGAAMLAIALARLAQARRVVRGARAVQDQPSVQDQPMVEDRHSSGGAVSVRRSRAVHAGWLMIAPVVAILVISPPALSTFTASHAPVRAVGAAPPTGFPALTGSSPHRLVLLEFTTRALWDAGRTLRSQRVELTGFVLTQRPDGFILARLVITCCAADARPVEVFVQARSRPPTGGWVTVTGSYARTMPGRPGYPVLAATSERPVEQPTNPYE